MLLQCPSCDDLCAPGATVCDCGQRLLPTRGDLAQALTVGVFREQEACCPTDLHVLDIDGYCSLCGRQDARSASPIRAGG